MSRTPAPGDGTRQRRPWTLRRQLVVLLIGLVLLICSVLAVVSTLSLRAELLGQIDADLTQASARATNRPQGLDLGGSGSGTPPTAGCTDATGCPTTDPGASLAPYQVPGQGPGDIDVLLSGSTVVRAGYFDESGQFRSLVGTEQLTTLDALPTDGHIHQVDLGDLGTFRAISTTTQSGDKVVTAMPTAPADDPR